MAVWDSDPGQRVLAHCHNFFISSKEEAIRTSDLIFCATGNKSLCARDFHVLQLGCVVLAATSADDEFDFSCIEEYDRKDLYDGMTRLQADGHHFYLANHGNAVNFLHGAEIRPYVHLVQAAMLCGIDMLLHDNEIQPEEGITTISQQREARLATMFERFVLSTQLGLSGSDQSLSSHPQMERTTSNNCKRTP